MNSWALAAFFALFSGFAVVICISLIGTSAGKQKKNADVVDSGALTDIRSAVRILERMSRSLGRIERHLELMASAPTSGKTLEDAWSLGKSGIEMAARKETKNA